MAKVVARIFALGSVMSLGVSASAQPDKVGTCGLNIAVSDDKETKAACWKAIRGKDGSTKALRRFWGNAWYPADKNFCSRHLIDKDTCEAVQAEGTQCCQWTSVMGKCTAKPEHADAEEKCAAESVQESACLSKARTWTRKSKCQWTKDGEAAPMPDDSKTDEVPAQSHQSSGAPQEEEVPEPPIAEPVTPVNPNPTSQVQPTNTGNSPSQTQAGQNGSKSKTGGLSPCQWAIFIILGVVVVGLIVAIIVYCCMPDEEEDEEEDDDEDSGEE